LRWLKGERESALPRNARHGGPTPVAARAPSHSKFLLEPLEPRVLLSADSIVGEVYRSLLDDEARGPGADFAVIVEEIDAATSAEITAADGNGFGSAASETSPTVAWPEGWQAGALEDSAGTSDSASLDFPESGVPAPELVAAQAPAAALIEQAAGASTALRNSDSGDDSELSTIGLDDSFASIIPDSNLARGPPADASISAALLAADSLRDNDLGLSDSPQGDERGLFAVETAPISDVLDDGLARAPL